MNPPSDAAQPRANGQAVSVAELFHRLNRVLPDEQKLLTVPPEMKAGDALALMQERRFSQVPIVVGSEILGVFSYRSFSRTVASFGEFGGKRGTHPKDIPVDECLEKVEFARVTDDFAKWFDVLDRDDVILVGEPSRLQGVVTAMDVLRYLYGVASPFVLVAEIELTLRALIHVAVTPEELEDCARRSLHKIYAADRIPTELSRMTFHDYVQLVGHGENWQHFAKVFGSSRERVRAKLDDTCSIRNTIFHFREPSTEEYQRLADYRDWMLMKARAVEARRREGAQ